MFDISAKNLWEEINTAESFRDIHLHKFKEQIERYTGEAFRDDNRQGQGWPENHMPAWD